jgi:chromosome segregation ATPase
LYINSFEQEKLDLKKRILQLEEQIQKKNNDFDKERSTWKEQLLRTSEMMQMAETELQAKSDLNEHLSVQLHEINDQILSGKISIEQESRKYVSESSQLKEKLLQEEIYRKQLEEGLKDLKRHLHKVTQIVTCNIHKNRKKIG